MTTTPAHTNPPPPSEEPEEFRSRLLLVALATPILAGPAVTAATALVIGRDPFPWPLVGQVLMWALFAASMGGMFAMLTPRLARFFGLPDMTRRRDERESSIFDRALLTSYVLTTVGLLTAICVTPSVTLTVLLVAQTASMWLSMIFYSRRI